MKNLTTRDAPAPIDPKKGFKIHFLVFLLVVPAIWAVWYWTDRSYPWPLWSTPAWAIGILFHYLGVYVFKRKIS
jgi:membrane protein YdbS with pleckstrin-like domain